MALTHSRRKAKKARRKKTVEKSPETNAPSRARPAAGDSGADALRENFPLLRKQMLAWFSRHGRRYPWRETGDWFHLLVAEMMLRRTRADQVVPVYLDFTKRYGTPARAARLSQDDLENLLSPLGLRWRGRQMYRTVQFLRDSYAKRAPVAGDDLTRIPGVGDYSSAMLRNRLFGERVAPVDANFVRFFTRLLGRPFRAEDRRRPYLIHLANDFVQSPRSRELNLAILDFGALVCRPARPDCAGCPLRAGCVTGREERSGTF